MIFFTAVLYQQVIAAVMDFIDQVPDERFS
jgi:hypothetical protein